MQEWGVEKMVKIGMLLPEERMLEPAKRIIEENHLNVAYMKAIVKKSLLFFCTMTVSNKQNACE